MCPMGVTHHHRLHQMRQGRDTVVRFHWLPAEPLLKNQPSRLGPCIVSTWVIDWTLMRGTKLIDLPLVSHAGYWVAHSPSSICKMTINVALLFGFDWFVVFLLEQQEEVTIKLFSLSWSSQWFVLSQWRERFIANIWLLFSLLLFQILFMNKLDLFQDKISHSGRHLRLYLPQFKGGPDVCSVTMSSFNIVFD